MDRNLALFFFMDDDFDLIQQVPGVLAQPVLNNLQIDERNPRIRNQNYYELVIPRYTDLQFKEHFRMSRELTEELVHVIGNNDHLAANQNYLAPLRKKVLFTIWMVSKSESFLATSDRFGMAPSTGHAVFKEIITVLSNLLPNYVQWPQENHYAASSAVFQQRSQGFPGIIGAIDGCHIPIKQPVGNSIDFYNRKGFHSIILQGICDETAKFIDVYIGMPGRMHDSRVFRNSPIYDRMHDDEHPIIPQDFHLIGDAAYPLMQVLLTPFRDTGHLTAAQSTYNTRLSSVRSIIERAFGLLKGKFRRLKYMDISDLDLANRTIAAACVLHNFTINVENEDLGLLDDGVYENAVQNLMDNEDVQHLGVAAAPIQKRNNIVTLFV